MNICSSLTTGYVSMCLKVGSFLNWCFPVVVTCDCESDCYGKPSSRVLYRLSDDLEDKEYQQSEVDKDRKGRVVRPTQSASTDYTFSNNASEGILSEYESGSGESDVSNYSGTSSLMPQISRISPRSLHQIDPQPDGALPNSLPSAWFPRSTLPEALVVNSAALGEQNISQCWQSILEDFQIFNAMNGGAMLIIFYCRLSKTWPGFVYSFKFKQLYHSLLCRSFNMICWQLVFLRTCLLEPKL